MICRLSIDKGHLHFIEQLGSLGQRRAFEQYNTRFGRGFVAMLAMSESARPNVCSTTPGSGSSRVEGALAGAPGLLLKHSKCIRSTLAPPSQAASR